MIVFTVNLHFTQTQVGKFGIFGTSRDFTQSCVVYNYVACLHDALNDHLIRHGFYCVHVFVVTKYPVHHFCGVRGIHGETKDSALNFQVFFNNNNININKIKKPLTLRRYLIDKHTLHSVKIVTDQFHLSCLYFIVSLIIK